MKDTTDSVKDKTTTEEKKEAPFKLPLWVIRKALKEDLSIQQLITYWWLYTHNAIARSRKHDDRIIFGKTTYDAIYMAIKNEYGIGRPDNACDQLEQKGWIKKALAPQFVGKRQVGYLCLLVESDRLQARAVQQEMQLTDEEAVIEVESSVDNSNGVYIKFGIPYYMDADGNEIQLPKNVPHRPTRTAVWCNDPEGWYEPEDLPEHDLEY
jgi:hypothetical protein